MVRGITRMTGSPGYSLGSTIFSSGFMGTGAAGLRGTASAGFAGTGGDGGTAGLTGAGRELGFGGGGTATATGFGAGAKTDAIKGLNTGIGTDTGLGCAVARTGLRAAAGSASLLTVVNLPAWSTRASVVHNSKKTTDHTT